MTAQHGAHRTWASLETWLSQEGQRLDLASLFKHLTADIEAARRRDQLVDADEVFKLGQLLEGALPGLSGERQTPPTLNSEAGPPHKRDMGELVRRMLSEDPLGRPPIAAVLDELSYLAGLPPAFELHELTVKPGQCLGSYRLLRRVGGGGMGVVFEAAHIRLSRRAAVKVIRPEWSKDQEMVNRFFIEAEAVNIVRHPGIVSIFEFGQLPDKTVYIVMEYLEGDSLHERLRRSGGRLGMSAIRLLRQVASALAAAHEKGVVHRDLKPENIMVVQDPEVPGGERTKLLDFGIAKMADDYRRSFIGALPHQTEIGQALGTPTYMAPEQCRDAAAVDDRADVYSLGVMIYEVLLGQPPFTARRFDELASQHLLATPRPLREQDPSLPVALERLLAGMLAKVPRDRPSMASVARELDRLLTEPGAPAAESTDGARRHPRGWLAALALASAVAGGAALWHGSTRRAQRPVEPQRPASAPAPAPTEDEIDLLRLRSLALLTMQEGLRDPDAVLRRKAASILGQSRDVRHAVLIEPLLRDLDPAVVAQAASSLAQLGARTAAPVLLLSLGQRPSPRVELAVAAALQRLGEPRGELLLRRLLRSRDREARRLAALLLVGPGRKKGLLDEGMVLDEQVVGVLGRLAQAGEREALAALRRGLAGARQGDLSLAIADELAHAEDAGGRTFLERLARAAGPQQLRAARLLAGLDDPSLYDLLIQRFTDASQALSERILAAEGLGACGRKESMRKLMAVLPREAGPLRLRMAAAGAILQIAARDPGLLAEESLRSAETGLDDERTGDRLAAATALGDADAQLAVPLLGRAIRDRQPEVRQQAARALGRTRVRAAVPVLGQALDDSVRGVRREALSSIGQVGQRLRQRGEQVDDILSSLSGRAGRGDDSERLMAATSLLLLGDRSRQEQIRSWLTSGDAEIRRQAIEAWSADPEAERAPLQGALKDPVFAVRFAAAARLAERGSREGMAVLKEALGRKGPDALIAHGLLGRLGEPSPIEAALWEGPLSVRLATVAAAAHLPPEEALSVLRQGARDPALEVRHKVIEMIADLPHLVGSAPGQRMLTALLADPDQGVRVHAGVLLARLGGRDPGSTTLALRDAQTEYLRGHYAQAIALARKQDSQPAWTIIGAAACRQRDAVLAEKAYRKLDDASMRGYVAAICQHTRTLIQGERPQEQGPPRPREARGDRKQVPDEKAIRNEQIGLPPKAMGSKIDLKE